MEETVHTKARRETSARLKSAKGALVAVKRSALVAAMERRGLSIKALARGVSGSVPGTATDPAESMRKRIASVLAGRQSRMRRGELRSVARVLKVALEGLIEHEVRELQLPAEIEAARVRREVNAAIGAQLEVGFEAPIEQLLTFDDWSDALGLLSVNLTMRQQEALRARFARAGADAILCLFETFKRGRRPFDERLWHSLVEQLLKVRERQLAEIRKPLIYDLSERSVLDIAMEKRRRFRNNPEDAWGDRGAVASATAEAVLPVSRGGSGASKRPKKSKPFRQR